MILNETEFYENLESFRNGRNYSQDKMAELIGMSTKQAYSNMIKNRTMKFRYFVELVKNTGISADYFLASRSSNQSPESFKRLNSFGQAVQEPVANYSCENCISKQKQIDALKIAVDALNELLEKYRKEQE